MPTKISIKDSLSQYAPTAKITTPDGVLEFSENVVAQIQSGQVISDIVPGGNVSLSLKITPTVEVEFFNGTIEFVDDAADSDRYESTVDASPLQKDRPWEQHTSFVWNSLAAPGADIGYSTSTIFSTICGKCGTTAGRFDVPNLNGVGTYEVDNQSAVEVATGLADPFNKFDFLKYYPRVTNGNTLNVYGIDFTNLQGEAYEATDIKSFHRTRSAYIPSVRVGNQSIFLTGGQTTGGLIPNNVTQSASAILTTNSRNSTFAPEYGDDGTNGGTTLALDEWVEVDTYVDFEVEYSGDVFVTPGTPLSALLDLGSRLDFLTSVKILNSHTTGQNTFYHNSILGLYKASYVTNSYQTVTYLPTPDNSASLSVQSLVPPALTNLYNEPTESFLLVRSTSIEYLYINANSGGGDLGQATGGSIPHIKTETYYLYSTTQQPLGTQVFEYLWIRDSWTLQHTDFTAPQNLTLATAHIQLNQLFNDAALVTAAYTDGFAGDPSDINSIFNRQKDRMGRFQTLDGEHWFEYQVTSGLYYSDKGFTMDVVDTAAMFNMGITYTDYTGLNYLYALIKQAQQIEIGVAYWEDVEITCLMDFSFTVGQLVTGSYAGKMFIGYCTDYSHDIDQDSAISTVKLRRLVLS